MIARKRTSSILTIVLVMGALTTLPGCFYDNPYNRVRWWSPEASYPLTRTDADTRSDGNSVPWRIVSIDTNRRAYWLVVEPAADGEPLWDNLELAFGLLSANYSADFLNDENKRQPALLLIGDTPDQVVGVSVDDRVLAGFGSRLYPGYWVDGGEEYRSCAPLKENAAVGEVFGALEPGDRVILRIQGGADRWFFGEEYEYVQQQ